jgi:carboxymethylenebutenolidase
MIELSTDSGTANGYLATPDTGHGPGVILLHAWWGLTEPFREACDRLAAAGYVALGLDLYYGKMATTEEDAEALGSALDQNEAQWSGDIVAATRYLRQSNATDHGKVAFVTFSLGVGYALVLSTYLPDDVGAVVCFYSAYTEPGFSKATASYLFHFAEDDPWTPTEEAEQMVRVLQAAGRPVTVYTYPGTKHWFFENNQPAAYNAGAAALAWERTLSFLNDTLRADLEGDR